jgi:hypothetical protein
MCDAWLMMISVLSHMCVSLSVYAFSWPPIFLSRLFLCCAFRVCTITMPDCMYVTVAAAVSVYNSNFERAMDTLSCWVHSSN